MRSLDEIKLAKDRCPFRPFLLHLADGREVRIGHPDHVAWTPGPMPRTVMVGHEGGAESLDLTRIVGIRTTESVEKP